MLQNKTSRTYQVLVSKSKKPVRNVWMSIINHNRLTVLKAQNNIHGSYNRLLFFLILLGEKYSSELKKLNEDFSKEI